MTVARRRDDRVAPADWEVDVVSFGKDKAVALGDKADDTISPAVYDARERLAEGAAAALERLGPAVEDARERLAESAAAARVRLGPAVDDARVRLTPYVDEAR